MTATNVGKEVEKRFDPEMRKFFDELGDDYLLVVAGPGTRTEADFRVQLDVYRKGKRRKDGTFQVTKIGYVQVTETCLDSLAVPAFFHRMGKEAFKDIRSREQNGQRGYKERT